MKSLYILLLTLAVSAVSCKTKEGEPGPAGESSLNKQGAISGKLTYVDHNGDPLEQSFSYEYFETLSQAFYTINEDNGQYVISISRRDLKDYGKGFLINLYGSTDQSGNPIVASQGSIGFSYLNVINNYLFSFVTDGGEGPLYFDSGKSSTTGEISNFNFNETTGRLIFDYTFTVSPDDIGNWTKYDGDTPATITGHVDVVVAVKKQAQMPS
jgi:hypothetical protein